MRLRDLSKENLNHAADKAAMYPLAGFMKTSPEKVEKFKNDWLQGKATLKDWIDVGKLDLDALEEEANLPAERLLEIRQRRKQLFDWYVEYRVQKVTMRNLYEVMEITPSYPIEFARNELKRVKAFLDGKLTDEEYKSLLKDTREVRPVEDSLIKNLRENNFNIFSQTEFVHVEVMKRYCGYLESFISDNGLLEREENEPRKTKGLLASMFVGLKELSENIILKYKSEPFLWEGEMHYSYDLIDVCGCYYIYEFKDLIRSKLREGFAEFVNRLQYVPIKDRTEAYQFLIEEVEKLRELVVEDATIIKDGDTEEVTGVFKKFKAAKYIGDRDGIIAFNEEARKRVNERADLFAIAWLEMVDEIIRRIEHASYSIDLMQFIQEAREIGGESDLSFEYVNYLNNVDALGDLYNATKKAGLIGKSTSLANFKRVFSGREVHTPIEWTGTVEELSYFIKQLHNEKRKVKNKGKRHWEVACHCFVKPESKRFERNKLRNQKVPASAERIERIVDLL
jgi:hypothetical protein